MLAGPVSPPHFGHDRLLPAQLCGAWDHRPAVQELRTLVPQTGRVSAEYCERPVASGQQTCREAGAFQQWTKKQSDDPVFKAYRKEYKKRFAWIKAGRITDEQFYAWSEQAREMKKKCDREVITLDELVCEKSVGFLCVFLSGFLGLCTPFFRFVS